MARPVGRFAMATVFASWNFAAVAHATLFGFFVAWMLLGIFWLTLAWLWRPWGCNQKEHGA